MDPSSITARINANQPSSSSSSQPSSSQTSSSQQSCVILVFGCSCLD
ncbi:hypothetical protein SLEP1_g37033 [Rubroshorea leprosula]|uniref:Uncharacterized protein n=1 Tax=Rubroshorea leprosula TaxID=152421 RepID=A0AAV5KTK3_9ROSI|nr:hypothetical protein SLEP1_g37033 [Rubroshorea leprosula]